MTSSSDQTIDIKQYIRMFWRHKGIVLLCTVTAICAALIALGFQNNVYTSRAVFLMEDPGLVSRDVVDLTGGIMQPRQSRDIDNERMARLAGRIRSRPFLERVVRILDMDRDPNVRELARRERESHPELSEQEMAIRIVVDNLQNRISFRTLGPGVYEIRVADFSPSGAQRLASWISTLFVRVSSSQALDRITEAETFGQDLLRRYDERLQRAEQNLEHARQSLIEADLAPRLIRAGNLRAAEGLHQKISDEAARANTRKQSYEDAVVGYGLSEDPVALLDAPAVGNLASRMAAALSKAVRERLSAETLIDPGEWPPAVYGGMRRELLQQVEILAGVRYPDASQDAAQAIAGLILSSVDIEAQTYAARMLEGELEDFRLRAASVPVREAELSRLEATVSRNNRLSQKVEDYVVGADVRRQVEDAKLGLQIEILDPAHLPLKPTSPNRRKILLASVLLGGLLGLGFAFLMETTDPVLRTAQDFGRIVPEPILGSVPLLKRRLRHRRSWLRRYWILLALIAVGLLTGGFFLARSRIIHKLAVSQLPVQTAEPEEGEADVDD